VSIANIDLLVVDLRLLLSSVETSMRHGIDHTLGALTAGAPARDSADSTEGNGT
jgi:hypothetical protein